MDRDELTREDEDEDESERYIIEGVQLISALSSAAEHVYVGSN